MIVVRCAVKYGRHAIVYVCPYNINLFHFDLERRLLVVMLYGKRLERITSSNLLLIPGTLTYICTDSLFKLQEVNQISKIYFTLLIIVFFKSRKVGHYLSAFTTNTERLNYLHPLLYPIHTNLQLYSIGVVRNKKLARVCKSFYKYEIMFI